EKLEFEDRLFRSWFRLEHYVASKQPIGLREPNPLDMIVVIQPTAFGHRTFDELSQTFTWDVHDEAHQVLRLSLPFRDWTKEAIRTLEGLSPSDGTQWRFVVRLVYENDELLVEPISILRSEENVSPVFQLALDSLGEQKFRRDAVDKTSSDVDHEEFDEP